MVDAPLLVNVLVGTGDWLALCRDEMGGHQSDAEINTQFSLAHVYWPCPLEKHTFLSTFNIAM